MTSKADRAASATSAFDVVIRSLRGKDIEEPTALRRGFGSNGLKVNGKIFAMLVGDALVVKLPRARASAMVEAGDGEPFDPGHGRKMKEWVTIRMAGEEEWVALAREACAFVRSIGPRAQAPPR